MYAVGVDLGTTFTAASTWRDGHAEIASLGSRAAVIPSVVLLREDETVLTGESASRRGLSEPHRVAREFKRRLGDTTPILLGGVPYSAEALMARMLRSVIDAVAMREGGPPSAVCVSHPANWGPYKTDLIRQAVRLAGLDQPVNYTTEPEAAAVFYARQQRIDPGAVVAVYDLGGGTFDAAVLRKTVTGFEILGQPEGIERLGGIDIDAAVFGHVTRALGGKLQELDENDPVAIAAVARLREECIQAKEVLSSDTDVAIAVLLPNISTEVRLTRAELEAMVRPALYSSVEALKRALRSAGVSPEQLHSVLLVGGSSRMPIVAQLVGAELGRPVAVDAHPKHAVALGAAWLASGLMSAPARPNRGVASVGAPPVDPATPVPMSGPPMSVPPVSASPVSVPPVSASPMPPPSAVPVGYAASAAPMPPEQSPVSSSPVSSSPVSPSPVASAPVSGMPNASVPVSSVPISSVPISPVPGSMTPVASVSPAAPGQYGTGPGQYGTGPGQYASASGQYPTGAGQYPVPPAAAPAPGARRPPIAILVAAGVVLLAVLVSGGVALALTGNNRNAASGPGPGASQNATSPGSGNESGQSPNTSNAGGSTAPTNPAAAVPADEQCTDVIKANPRWVCLTKATDDGTKITIEYEANFAGATPNVNGSYHLHIYGGDGTTPADRIMGTQAGGSAGAWYVEDKNPSVKVATSGEYKTIIGKAAKVCARIANGSHQLIKDNTGNGTYKTGNCVPITRAAG